MPGAALEPLDIHRLRQAVLDGLPDQRMIRNFALAGQILRAGDLVREHRADQVFGTHAGKLRRHLSCRRGIAAARALRRHPAPAGREHRRVEQSLGQTVRTEAECR
jgi:hypothetical protein